MVKIETRRGPVYLAPDAVASLEEVYMGDRGLTTVIRTFDGRTFEAGTHAATINNLIEAERKLQAGPA